MTKLVVSQNETGERLDIFLAQKFPDYSRNYFANLIKEKNVLVNKKSMKSSYKIKSGDEIEIEFIEPQTAPDMKPENIDLNIVYEDKNVIVINKPAGLVVHPAAGNLSGTLVNALLNYFPKITMAVYDKKNSISRIRPGLVHRLDKDTSGILIVAKNAKAMNFLSRQIQNHAAEKTYLAICFGRPKKSEGRLVSFLGRHPKNRKIIADIGKEKGKGAVSHYKVLRNLPQNLSILEFKIETGRTHQIRVQAANMGNPVMGDLIYGNKESMKLSYKLKIKRQLLHALKLKITIPDNKDTQTFVAPIPKDFVKILKK